MFFCHKERRNCNCWNTSEYENKLYHHNQCNHSLQSHVFLWRTKSHAMICIFFFLFLWLFLFAMVFVDEWRRLHTQAVSSFCMLLLLPSLLRGAGFFCFSFIENNTKTLKIAILSHNDIILFFSATVSSSPWKILFILEYTRVTLC